MHLHKSQTYHSNDIITCVQVKLVKHFEICVNVCTIHSLYCVWCVRVKLSHGDNSTILNGLKQQSAPHICHRSSKLQKHHKIPTIYFHNLFNCIVSCILFTQSFSHSSKF